MKSLADLADVLYRWRELVESTMGAHVLDREKLRALSRELTDVYLEAIRDCDAAEKIERHLAAFDCVAEMRHRYEIGQVKVDRRDHGDGKIDATVTLRPRFLTREEVRTLAASDNAGGHVAELLGLKGEDAP